MGLSAMSHDPLTDDARKLNALGQLSSGVGHHVINAFAAIVSNAEMLRLTAQMPGAVDTASTAELIINTAVDASGVARRLIDYSRPATTPGTELLTLDRLAAEVVEAGRAAERPGVAWEAELLPVPPIQGHLGQLQMMLDLLLANALEALPAGGGTITLATGRDERGWVVMEIRDDGNGLTREAQARAVEPFFTTKPGRLGVGLSIANGIWRRHRGTLSVRPQPDRGVVVRLLVEPAKDPATSLR